jgi:tetratricopeptide (TPR) repeat protein
MEEQFVPETEEAPEDDATELTYNRELHIAGTTEGNGAGTQLPGALEDDPRSDPRDSLSRYKDAVRQNPASARHLAELAEGYAAADLPHKALQQYQRALETQRESGEEEMPDAHLGIGDICRTFAMSAVAVRSYERAVRLRPKRPFYRWKLAVALAAMGLYDQAEAQLLKAIELAPTDTYYRFQLADVYLLMGRDEAAIESLQTVVKLAPRDDYYCLRLGAALLRAERAAEAVPQFERAVQLKPENSSYRTLLRYAYSRNHQEPSISVDVEMLELGPYDEDFVRRIQRMAQPVARV